MTNTIYVVFGTTGEYSDRSEWPVRAFRTEAQAQELIEKASAAAREVFLKYESGELHRWDIDDGDFNPYDSKMQIDYTGTTYYIYKVELDE